VTRRPASRRPPKLDDPVARAAAREPKAPRVRDRLKASQVAGRSAQFGRDEVVGIMRRLVEGDARVRFGMPPVADLAIEQVETAVTAVFGWKGDGPRARIAPANTHTAFVGARDRVREVARAGGRIAFATARPASMLGVYRALAAAAADDGAQVLEQSESGIVGPGGRRLWWIDGVAVLTDHESLLGQDSVAGGDELLFCLPAPDLVVADHGYAGVALARGHEVVAFADLDAVVLAVAAWRGQSVRVVPLDQQRPPVAYAPLLDVLAEPAPEPDLGLDALPVDNDDPALDDVGAGPRL
jgi:hypothetical protein